MGNSSVNPRKPTACDIESHYQNNYPVASPIIGSGSRALPVP
jgi:hypothetical protein